MSPPHSFTSKRAVSPNPYLDNPVNGYACPTGMALHYDDVPINGTVRPHLFKLNSTQNAWAFLTCHILFLLLLLLPTQCSEGGSLTQEVHYENADLYDNMPPPKLAAVCPPKSSSASSSSSHYKTPKISKVSSKFLSADTKPKDAAQVTNTPLTCFLLHTWIFTVVPVNFFFFPLSSFASLLLSLAF